MAFNKGIYVHLRETKNKYHIRFRCPSVKGRKEIIESYPKQEYIKKEVSDKCAWYKEEIKRGYNPWQNESKIGIGLLASEALKIYLKDGIESGKWRINNKGDCRTAQTNKERIQFFIREMGDLPVQEIDRQVILSFLNRFDANPTSKKNALTSLNTFLKWLYSNNYKMHLVKVDLPKSIKDKAKEIEKQVRGVSIGELKRLCVAMRIREQQMKTNKYNRHWKSREWAICAFQFTFVLMLRREEINSLYPGDFKHDLTEFTIGNLKEPHREEFIPKGGIATVPTTKLARSVLRDMNIHKMPKNQPIIKRSNDQVYRKIKEAQRIALPDKRVRLHDLRHGMIMHLRSQGWPDSLISQLARHASSEVTSSIYSGVDPVELRRTLRHFDT